MERMLQEDFDSIYETIWQNGSLVRYENPDSWFNTCKIKQLC